MLILLHNKSSFLLECQLRVDDDLKTILFSSNVTLILLPVKEGMKEKEKIKEKKKRRKYSKTNYRALTRLYEAMKRFVISKCSKALNQIKENKENPFSS